MKLSKSFIYLFVLAGIFVALLGSCLNCGTTEKSGEALASILVPLIGQDHGMGPEENARFDASVKAAITYARSFDLTPDKYTKASTILLSIALVLTVGKIALSLYTKKGKCKAFKLTILAVVLFSVIFLVNGSMKYLVILDESSNRNQQIATIASGIALGLAFLFIVAKFLKK
jgi:hypothetical protein